MTYKTIPEVLSDRSGVPVGEMEEFTHELFLEFFDGVYGDIAEYYNTTRIAIASEIYYRHPELLTSFGEMVARNVTENIILDEQE